MGITGKSKPGTHKKDRLCAQGEYFSLQDASQF
jgi:hypothetical protein